MKSIFIFEFNRSFTRHQLVKMIHSYGKTVFDTNGRCLQELAEMLVDCDNEEYGY